VNEILALFLLFLINKDNGIKWFKTITSILHVTLFDLIKLQTNDAKLDFKFIWGITHT